MAILALYSWLRRASFCYAPETEFLREKGFVVWDGQEAVPTTWPMYDALSKKGEEVVRAIEKAADADSNKLNYSCQNTIGLELGIDVFVSEDCNSWHWSDYTDNFNFDDVREPDLIIYGREYSGGIQVGHAALVAYNHPVDRSLTITVQTDGSATRSGIFFIHVKDSIYTLNNLYNPIAGKRK